MPAFFLYSTIFFFSVISTEKSASNIKIYAKINPNKSIITGIYEQKTNISGQYYFWLYPNKLSKKHPYTDDRNISKLYPIAFNSGYIHVIKITENGKNITYKLLNHNKLNKILLKTQLTAKTKLQIHFKVKIPQRYGRFGCIKQRCFLGVPWYPILVSSHKYKYAKNIFTQPIQPFKHTLTIKIPNNYQLFLNGLFKNQHTITRKTPFFPVVVAKNLKQKCKKHICMTYYSYYSSLTKYITGTNLPKVLKTVENSYSNFIKSFKKIDNKTKFRKIHIIEAPMRVDLAVALPLNTMFFAHKTFAIFPAESFYYFHKWFLSKTIMETFFLNYLTEKHEKYGNIVWLSDFLAIFFSKKKKAADTLLKFLDFIPQIDNILRVPNMDFPAAYFSGVNMLDIYRDDFRRFNNNAPPGSTIYYKLIENLGKPTVTKIINKYLKSNIFFNILLNRQWFKTDNFLKIWTNFYPKVNFSIINFKKQPLKNGKNLYKIGILKTGQTNLAVPVTLVVKSKGKDIAILSWNGKEEYHSFKFKTNYIIDQIEINQNKSILETPVKIDKTEQYDNYYPKPGWRYIFTGINALYNVTDVLSNIVLDMDFIPKYDLKKRINMAFVRNDFLEYAFDVSYSYYFGPQILPTRLAYYLSAGLVIGQTRPLVDYNNTKGVLIRGLFLFTWNTRKNYIYPRRGSIGRIGVFFNTVNTETTKSPKHNAEIFAFNASFAELPWGMTFGIFTKVASIIGQTTSSEELLRLGGPNAVAGYSVSEFFGRYLALLTTEIRHPLISSLQLNLGGVIYVNSVTGAFNFSMGGISDGIKSEELKNNFLWAMSVGYALRFHISWLGIYNGVFNFQINTPLKRYETTTSPFTFFISVAPSF